MLSVSVWFNGCALDRFALEPRQVALGLAALSLGPALLWLGALRSEAQAGRPPSREIGH